MVKRKTSAEWLKEQNYIDSQEGNPKIKIVDYDGWDRNNLEYSFYKEKITYQEFINRLCKSTLEYIKK